MNNELREDVFDTVLASAFSEYMDKEAGSMPSKEELDKEYPAPKNGLRRIKREIKKNRPKSRAMVYFQRIAVVFLVAVTLFTGVMSLSTEVRSAVSNAIVGWFDKFARVSFGEEPVVPAKVIENVGDFEIGYVPDGLELVDSTEDDDGREYTYTSDDGRFMFIGIYSPDSTTYTADIEISEYDTISVNDKLGHIFYNDDEKSGSIVLENNEHTIIISCILDNSELIKVAENIK